MEKQLITGNEPARPILDPNGTYYREGLSIRQHFAAIAFQGLLANSNYKIVYNPSQVIEECAKDAVIASDALIEALNK